MIGRDTYVRSVIDRFPDLTEKQRAEIALSPLFDLTLQQVSATCAVLGMFPAWPVKPLTHFYTIEDLVMLKNGFIVDRIERNMATIERVDRGLARLAMSAANALRVGWDAH